MAIQSGTQARPNFILTTIRNPAFRARLVQAGLLTRRTPLFVRWALLLFIFTFPFEALDLGLTAGTATASRIAGLLFAGLYFLSHNPLSERGLPRLPSSVWWFLLYLMTYVMLGLFIPGGSLRGLVGRFVTFAQLLVMFWILSDLLKSNSSRRRALLSYGVACALVAAGVILGLPGFSPATTSAEARETFGDMDPNVFGTYLSLALVILMGLFLSGEFKSIIARSFLAAATLPLLFLIVRTGSRTGIAVAVIGCSTYLLPVLMAKISKLKRSTALLVGLLGIIGIGFIVAHNPDALERWKQVYYEQKLSGRERIIPTGIEMFLERPLFGWGPMEYSGELGFRLGEWGGKGGHNLILDLLLQVGIVGTIPALLGLWLCFMSAWRARRGAAGLLPLAAFLTIMAGNMAIPILYRRPMWFVLALAVAGGRIALAERAWRHIAKSPGRHHRKQRSSAR